MQVQQMGGSGKIKITHSGLAAAPERALPENVEISPTALDMQPVGCIIEGEE